MLQAEGQAKAIEYRVQRDPRRQSRSKVLAYQYLQALPQIAAGGQQDLDRPEPS